MKRYLFAYLLHIFPSCIRVSLGHGEEEDINGHDAEGGCWAALQTVYIPDSTEHGVTTSCFCLNIKTVWSQPNYCCTVCVHVLWTMTKPTHLHRKYYYCINHCCTCFPGEGFKPLNLKPTCSNCGIISFSPFLSSAHFLWAKSSVFCD